MEIKTFVNEFHPSTRIYSDEDRLIFAAMQRIIRQSEEEEKLVDELLIAVCSAKPDSDVLPIKHPRWVFNAMSRDTTITTDMLRLPAKEYPFAQRGVLRRFIHDPEANKLIDGLPDQYASTATLPNNVDEAIQSHYADLVAREESTTMFAMAENRSVARLGNAILFPVQPSEYLL